MLTVWVVTGVSGATQTHASGVQPEETPAPVTQSGHRNDPPGQRQMQTGSRRDPSPRPAGGRPAGNRTRTRGRGALGCCGGGAAAGVAVGLREVSAFTPGVNRRRSGQTCAPTFTAAVSTRATGGDSPSPATDDGHTSVVQPHDEASRNGRRKIPERAATRGHRAKVARTQDNYRATPLMSQTGAGGAGGCGECLMGTGSGGGRWRWPWRR